MRINPVVAFLFNLILPICVMFPGNRYQHWFFLVFASLVLVITGRLRRLFYFITAYGIITALSMLIGGMSHITGNFIYVFIIISLQFVPCMMMASVLVIDYSANEIISSLTPFNLPKTFVVSLTILLRYIPTFRKEFSYIKESMRLRNIPYTVKRPLKSFEFFLVPQLFRCAILADEITSAGLVKGITSPACRTSYYDMRMKPLDWLLCGILITGMVIFLWYR